MEINSKLLSVIVPVYNAEDYLCRCVDSILAQTWTNIEVILVDDGSSDNSGTICDNYSKSDCRIKVIHKRNGGVASARNAGIDFSHGEYIAFVDSDDYISNDMYEQLFGAISSEKTISICDFMMDYGHGHMEAKTTVEVGGTKVEAIKSLLLSDVGGGSVYMISPRETIGNLRFPEYLCNGEDFWFVIRLFSHADTIVKVATPMYFYNRTNSESLTHTLNDNTDLKGIIGLTENLNFIKESGMWEAVEKEWSWNILRFKSTFVMTPSRFKLYRRYFPEANDYVSDCPLLSSNIKRIMRLLNHNLDIIAAPIVLLYHLKRCITHTS